MRIGELSDATGASIRSLRYYEEQDLVSPRRTAAGYRVFDEADVSTIRAVQVLIAAGVRMDLIRDIVSCMQGEDMLLEACRARLAQERERLSTRIDAAVKARDNLDALLRRPPPGAGD